MGKRNRETIGDVAPTQEESSELSVLGESIRRYYRRLPSRRVDEMIRDRSAEAYIQRLCGLAAHYKRDFSPQQLDEMINAVGADFSAEQEANSDFWGGVHPNTSLRTLSATLASRHGQRLSEAQVNRLVEGHLANGLGVAALEPLLTQHDKDLSAYADQLLEISSDYLKHDFSAVLIKHYGDKLRLEQVEGLLNSLIENKQHERESLETAISFGGVVDGYQLPYGRFAVVRDSEREMLLDRRAKGIHDVFANIIQHVPELTTEQVDRLIGAGNGLTHAQLLAFKFEGLTPEQYQAILSQTNSTTLCHHLVRNKLPMPKNKEELMDNMIENLRRLGWREREAMVAERFTRHFSARNIDQLIECELGSDLIFKALGSWPGEITPIQIDAIIDGLESSLPISFVRQLGSRLSPDQARKVIAGSSSEVATALIHNYPEYFSLSDTEAKIDMLLAYSNDHTSQSWLVETYGKHFLPRQINALLDNRYGPTIAEFIERHPNKFSSEHIKKSLEGSMVKVKKRSELFAMHRQVYLAEADKLIASESSLVEYLIEQCGDYLSAAQIDQLIEADDLLYTQERILNHCAHRLSHAQIDRLMDIMRKREGSSLFASVTQAERVPGLMVKLVAVVGSRMTPAQIDGIIQGSSLYQSKLVSELLASHKDCLSEQQINGIAARFGHVL